MIRMFHGFAINFRLSNPVKKFTKRFHFIAICFYSLSILSSVQDVWFHVSLIQPVFKHYLILTLPPQNPAYFLELATVQDLC